VRKDLDDSGKEKLEAMLLTMQKDTEGDRTLKELGARQLIKTSGNDFRTVNEYAEYARAVGLNFRIQEDAH
jgi:ABC-type phosphate/phosphonate transport system substrate-binding protein